MKTICFVKFAMKKQSTFADAVKEKADARTVIIGSFA
jgi:hypothetical protein